MVFGEICTCEKLRPPFGPELLCSGVWTLGVTGGSEGIEGDSRTVEMRRAESVREAERLLQRAAAGQRGINFNDLAWNGSGHPLPDEILLSYGPPVSPFGNSYIISRGSYARARHC